MTQPQREATMSFWQRAQGAVGVFSAVLGVVVVIVGLPDKITSALGRTESRAAKLDIAEKRAALAAAGPRLEVSYLIVADGIESLGTTERQRKRRTSREAVTLLSFPSVREDAITEQAYLEPKGCGLGADPQNSVAYLVIENRGKRDASNVTVRGERLRLSETVRVQETAAGGDDYVAKLRTGAEAAAPDTVSLPRSIAPGAGYLVPVWVSASVPLWKAATRPTATDRWCVVSRSVLLPKTLTFVDLDLDTSVSTEVRRLRSPVILGEGIQGAG
jgi:hypothetical protein